VHLGGLVSHLPDSVIAMSAASRSLYIVLGDLHFVATLTEDRLGIQPEPLLFVRWG